MERINVRVESHLKRQLEDEARQKGVSPSDIVRKALEEHFQQNTPAENCRQLAERLGILGVYKDTPTDLSTNPAHMEGFGLG
jgi:metal-responsive CopG/Arc/MetJ family transcriptional regulator